MSVDLDIDVKSFLLSIDKYEDEVIRELQEAIRDTSYTIQEEAVELCPVDSGWLREHIDVEVDMSRLEGSVGSNVEYAPFVEYGTSRQQAQPFLRPAFDNNVEAFERRVQKALEE